MTLSEYAALPHALFSAAGGDGLPSAIDTALDQMGLRRRVAVTLPHVVAVPFAVAGTDLVATMAERVARRFAASAGVAVLPLPCEVAAFDIDLLHARRALADPALRWLMNAIATAAAD